MAAISNQPQFFDAHTEGFPGLEAKSYKMEGTLLKLPRKDLCPIVKKSFQELFKAHFQTAKFPYAVVYIQCKNSSVFCDGTAAIRRLEKSFQNPQTGETAEKVYLFIRRISNEDFFPVLGCSQELSQEMKESTLAFSAENSQEIRNSRAAFFKNKTKMCSADLVPLYERGLEEDPNNASILFALAKIYEKGSRTVKQDFKKAADFYLRLVKLYPQNRAILSALGHLYFLGGNGLDRSIPKAEECFLCALKIQPDDKQSLMALVSIYWIEETQNAAHAVALLEEFLKKKPEDIEILMWLAKLYQFGKKEFLAHHKRAIELWEKIYLLFPRKIDLICKMAQEDAKNNIQLFREALTLDVNDNVAREILGALLLDDGHGAPANDIEGIALLEFVAEKDPSSTRAHILLGEFWQRGGLYVPEDKKKAIAHYKEAIKIDPTNIEALTWYARLLFATVEYWPEAERINKRILELDRENSEAWKLLGEMYRIGGNGIQQDSQKAFGHFTAAFLSNQEDPFILIGLGSLYLGDQSGVKQDLEKARDYFSRALRLQRNNQQAIQGLVTVARKMQQASSLETTASAHVDQQIVTSTTNQLEKMHIQPEEKKS